jgi:hypothetical protein
MTEQVQAHDPVKISPVTTTPDVQLNEALRENNLYVARQIINRLACTMKLLKYPHLSIVFNDDDSFGRVAGFLSRQVEADGLMSILQGHGIVLGQATDEQGQPLRMLGVHKTGDKMVESIILPASYLYAQLPHSVQKYFPELALKN